MFRYSEKSGQSYLRVFTNQLNNGYDCVNPTSISCYANVTKSKKPAIGGPLLIYSMLTPVCQAITPNAFPTLVKAVMACSIWCDSCAAESCTRMRARSLGTTG